MTEQENTQKATSSEGGIVQGVAGRNVEAGILDLRGVSPEQVAEMESLEAGIVLVDEGNREALAKVPKQEAGIVVTAGRDLRVLVQGDLEISKAMLEGMPGGQQLLIVGNIFFRPDVPPALVAEKLEEIRIVGVLVACEGVLGAVLGKGEIQGVTIPLPDDVGPVVRSIGKNTLSKDYLSRLEDRTTYINIGVTTVPAELTEEMLAAKIAAYHNVGVTVGPASLLGLLKSRCRTDMGAFREIPSGG